MAFTALHVRSLIPHPIISPMTLDQLGALLPPYRSAYEGIAYQRQEGLLEGGFAWQAGPLVLYGQQSDGSITTLGVQGAPGISPISPDLVTALAAVMTTHHLYLVDWCNMALVTAETQALQNYFNVLFAPRGDA